MHHRDGERVRASILVTLLWICLLGIGAQLWRLTQPGHRAEALTLLAYALGFTGALLSLWQREWHWFARFGSLIVVVGIILTGAQFIESGGNFSKSVDETFARIREEAPPKIEVKRFFNDDQERWLAEWMGIWVLIMGTIIWGFGDLLDRLVPLKKRQPG